MNFAIIDDSKEYCEFLSKIIREVCNKEVFIYLYNDTYDMEEANIYFDLLFLNIDMPHIAGLEYSHQNRDKKIIFIAYTNKQIKQAFGPNIYAFIEKTDLIRDVRKIIQEKINHIIQCHYVSLKIRRSVLLFNIDDILYCQYIGGNTIAFVYRNQQYLYKGSSLKKIKNILGEQFIHTDQSVLINRKKIICLENDKLYIDGIKQYFMISARNKTKIKKLFLQNSTFDNK